LGRFERVREEIFVLGQWFLPLLINGENGVSGFEAVWFQSEQLCSGCFGIDRD
jgi:hypothetical protein